jgi:hypothetical protein
MTTDTPDGDDEGTEDDKNPCKNNTTTNLLNLDARHLHARHPLILQSLVRTVFCSPSILPSNHKTRRMAKWRQQEFLCGWSYLHYFILLEMESLPKKILSKSHNNPGWCRWRRWEDDENYRTATHSSVIKKLLYRIILISLSNFYLHQYQHNYFIHSWITFMMLLVIKFDPTIRRCYGYWPSNTWIQMIVVLGWMLERVWYLWNDTPYIISHLKYHNQSEGVDRFMWIRHDPHKSG